MKIINLVDSVSTLNYGIWHPVIINIRNIEELGHSVELWHPAVENFNLAGIRTVPLKDLSSRTLEVKIVERDLSPENTVVVSHGAWQYATRWGAKLKKRGFRWIHVPHGMLEGWPMKQKWLKKKIYYHLLEKRSVNKADLVRAVSHPEARNLQKEFPNSTVRFIPNSVYVPNFDQVPHENRNGKKRFLFLSRLHHKKNLVALLQAWLSSSLNNQMENELIIAGPDQGELKNIEAMISQSDNVRYVGPVYNSEKQELFNISSFFILPSFSEGLPSALLEAMGSALVPIITDGCNLPEVFKLDLGFRIQTNMVSIREGLEEANAISPGDLMLKMKRNNDFAMQNYSINAITISQIQQYLYKN